MFILEGTIGAGKSTFLKLIKQQHAFIEVAFEPVNNWQSTAAGQSILAQFYQDPQRWAYTMETTAMLHRVQEHLKDQDNPYQFRLIERSIYSGHYCFALNSRAQGFMTAIEWEAYTSLFNFLIPEYCKIPAGFIYLKVDPEIAYERIKKRNRLAEEGIPLSYVQQINACHENFLLHKQAILPTLKNVPVLILDCNEEFETDSQKALEYFKQVITFMEQVTHKKAHLIMQENYI
ncbi:MAG: deoxynucleoside kinase [Candidatus Babeliaceae bacterium]